MKWMIGWMLMFAVLVALLALIALGAEAVSGAYSAKAGTGGVTKGLFVCLESSGTLPVVATATAVDDKTVGVCEQTAAEDAMTRYAPIGTRTIVTSGELIAVGDLLTAGTGGKAFVLDTDDPSTQRIAAVALTAASGADEDVTVTVVASSVEQHQAITDGNFDTPDIDGGTVDGAIIGGATPAAVTGTTFTGTTFTDGTATIVGGVATTLTLDGDDNTVQDLGVTVPKVLTTSGGADVGLSFILCFEPSEAGTLAYTVPAGKALRVLDAWGFKTVGAGAHADDDLNLQNNDGTAANIFDTEELNTIADKARIEFDNLDDSETDVAAGDTLDLVANENAEGGCDARIYVLCVWATP